MAGNLLSVALWVVATDFRTFLASRIVGGLSEGNIQLATSIAADISDEKSRGSTMALIGICFSIAFTFGPALGAALSNVTTVAANPFATAAAFSLFLILVETIYLYLYLPETLPSMTSSKPLSNGNIKKDKQPVHLRTNSHLILNMTHFVFILFFSGMEFSFPFMTYDLFSYGSSQSGRLLGFIGLCATMLEGAVTRRLPSLRMVQIGVTSCVASFFLLGRVQTEGMLYLAAALLAVTNATVVTGLKSLSSLEAGPDERGRKLGNHRSWGKFEHFKIESVADSGFRSGWQGSWPCALLFAILVGRKERGIFHWGAGHVGGVCISVWRTQVTGMSQEEHVDMYISSPLDTRLEDGSRAELQSFCK